MNAPRLFINRPIATTMLAVALFLSGLLGYRALPVAALPQVDFPTIQVSTTLPGASAQTMQALVTTPLERQLGQIAGLVDMSSTSGYGTNTIVLQFTLDRDIDAAGEDVQAAINAAGGSLPKSLPYPPVYSKANPADPPIMTLALTSATLPVRTISDAADTVLGQSLSRVSGVGLVSIAGDARPAVRIRIDPARLEGYGLSLEDVRSLLGSANVDQAKGTIQGLVQGVSIGANDQIVTPEQYGDLVLGYRNGAALRLRDVGSVVNGIENTLTGATADGKPAVLVDIRRQPGANVIQTVDRVRALLPKLRSDLPAGIDVDVLTDRTVTIRASVNDVEVTLLISIGLVVLVIFAFLGDLRATLIPAVALPLSLVGTFGVMALCGFSLDNLSLMALTVGTGFVVDDAIVMIENVVRHVETGKKPLDAAIEGAGEIGFTILSLTVSLVAVFIPLLFMTGITGRLFREFAVTLTIAVVVSAVVSLTLTPMMCAHVLRRDQARPKRRIARLLSAGDTAFAWLMARYEASLDRVLRHQAFTMLVAVGALTATIGLYVGLPKGFLPREDTGLLAITTRVNPDLSFPEVERRQGAAAALVRRDPAVAAVGSVVGVDGQNATTNVGRMTVVLKARDRRDPANTVAARIEQAASGLVGLSLQAQSVQDIQIGTRPSPAPYQYTLIDADAAELARWAPKLLDALRGVPGLETVSSDQELAGRSFEVTVDRAQASRLGVTMQALDDTLYDAFGQRQVSTIFGQQTQYRVVLETDPPPDLSADALTVLRVKSTSGSVVPLAAFATVTQAAAPLALTRDEQFPAMTLSFDLAPHVSLGAAVDRITAAQRAMGLPAGIVGHFSGDAAEFQSSLASEPWLIGAPSWSSTSCSGSFTRAPSSH